MINEIGLCLMCLGRLREAVPSYERAAKGYFEGQDWSNASTTYRNLADLHAHLGTCLQRADHLRRTGDLDYARRVTEAKLQICGQQHWVNQISWCYRVLVDLDFDSGNYESARKHYESALKIARSISYRPALIEALLARGSFLAKVSQTSEVSKTLEVSPAGTVSQAFSDLNEALGYCLESDYRIYEADVRVALAWVYLADLTLNPSPGRRGELLARAKQSAERALQMSNEMGYHWGKVDAEEILGVIARSNADG